MKIASRMAASARQVPVARRFGVAAITSLVLPFIALQASAQSGCPSNTPNVDYNCPVGPVYIMPSRGNVPWSNAANWTSIGIGDLDGDGFDELVGRDAMAFACTRSVPRRESGFRY